MAAKSNSTEIALIELRAFKTSKISMAKEIIIDLTKNLKKISMVKIKPKKSGAKNEFFRSSFY